MNHKKILVKKSDGSVCIIIPTHEATPELLERDAKAVDGYVSHRNMEDDEIPRDRYFRNAWSHAGDKLHIDMVKARTIHMNNLRNLRSQKFVDMGFPMRLNDQVEKAILDESTQKKLKDLRDIPQTYDLGTARTPDELKGMIPDILR